MIKQKQQENEMLSSYMDAEQADSETSDIITRLLNEPDYQERYMRLQQVSDHFHNRLSIDISTQISSALDDLPSHFVSDSVVLETLKTEKISVHSGLYRFVGGLSVAASVMLVTFFSLQVFTSSDGQKESIVGVSPTATPLVTKTLPTKNLPSDELPSSPVKYSPKQKQNYQWEDADPQMSQSIREYINKHGVPREAYSLQAKVRSANYQTEH